MELKDYIIEYRNSHDLSQRQFADSCGVSNGYISMLEHGENPNTKQPIIPSITMLKKLANGMGITLNELFADVDDMQVVLNEQEGKESSNIIPMPKTQPKPLVGAIACGTPILAEENIERYISVPEYVRCDFCLTCKGDSMINARIYDGDIVCIRKQDTVDDGEIAAVLIDDSATLKRIRLYNDHIVLEPENPQYRPLAYWEEEMNQVHILGKATHFISEIR